MPNYLTPQQTSELLGVTPATLTNWRSKNLHLPYFKPSGKCVLYRQDDVLAYIESTVTPVSRDQDRGER